MSKELNPAAIENKINAELGQLTSYNIRTNLFNLVLFYNEAEEGTIEELLSYIFGKRPARIIHIQSKDVNVTSAYVKVRCFPDYEQIQVCFQEIVIQNGYDNIGKSTGSWVPLCIHDIPIIIIWLCNLNPFPSLLQTFFGIADKVIFCTEFNEILGENPFSLSSHILKKILPYKNHSLHPKLTVSDFTWLKSLPLRQRTASLFDPVNMRSALYNLHKITVSGMRRSGGLLYFLWLASRLDWNLIHKDDAQLQFYDRNRHIVTAQLTDSSRRQIIFTTWEKQEFTITWHSLFSIDNSNREKKDNTSRSCPFGNQEQLLQELDSLEPDLLYYNSLKKLTRTEQLKDG